MKKEIWKNKELKSAIGIFVISILLGAFSAYVGYLFCRDNEYNAIKGVIFGFLIPFVYGVLYQLLEKIRYQKSNGFLCFLLMLLYLYLCTYIPIWIGIILMAIVIYLVILQIRIAFREAAIEKTPVRVEDQKKDYPQEAVKLWKDEEQNTENEDLEEEFYCERCFEKISQEEYEGNDGMCESCYEDMLFEKERE